MPSRFPLTALAFTFLLLNVVALSACSKPMDAQAFASYAWNQYFDVIAAFDDRGATIDSTLEVIDHSVGNLQDADVEPHLVPIAHELARSIDGNIGFSVRELRTDETFTAAPADYQALLLWSELQEWTTRDIVQCYTVTWLCSLGVRIQLEGLEEHERWFLLNYEPEEPLELENEGWFAEQELYQWASIACGGDWLPPLARAMIDGSSAPKSSDEVAEFYDSLDIAWFTLREGVPAQYNDWAFWGVQVKLGELSERTPSGVSPGIDAFTMPWEEGFSITGSAGAEEFAALDPSYQQILHDAGCNYE